MNSFPYKRIVVIGTTSSGKSTLAQVLSKRLGVPYVELDALYWDPNWQAASLLDFWLRVEAAIEPEDWVVAGNYSSVRDLIWERAELIIWLDYSFYIVFWRLLIRTIRRAWTQEELWNSNRETFWVHLKLWSQDSLFHWLFKTYWRRKREIPIFLARPEYVHLRSIRFKHPLEAEEWLETLKTDALFPDA